MPSSSTSSPHAVRLKREAFDVAEGEGCSLSPVAAPAAAETPVVEDKLVEDKLVVEQNGGPAGVAEAAPTSHGAIFYTKWISLFLFSLYLFLFGLAVMGDSFKALSGKGAADLMTSVSNPVTGLMVGIIVTVLLQSSSTTTSIVTAMVGAEILGVKAAIPVIMGANIGTSVTNTIVAHGQVNDMEQFQRAFAGATVHDMFNMLCVLTLLPVEVITGALGWPLLYSLTESMTTGLEGMDNAEGFSSPIKAIVSPLSKAFIVPDKDAIKIMSLGCQSCSPTPFLIAADSVLTFPAAAAANGTAWCQGIKISNSKGWEAWGSKFLDTFWAEGNFMDEGGHPCYSLGDAKTQECEIMPCYTEEQWTEKYMEGDLVKDGFLLDLFGSSGAAVTALVISLVVLCTALYLIVHALQKLVMSGGGEGKIITKLKKILDYPYISMFFGMLLTISVQSSSIVTSTLTPLVGIGVISLEQMLPLTLGANIGTTCTAFLASLVSMKRAAIQIALCHLLFNVFGILIWFPTPAMRLVPLNGARRLGELVVQFRWFGMFYIFYAFITVPLVIYAVSGLFNMGTAGIVFGILIVGLILGGAFMMINKFEVVVAIVKRQIKKHSNSTNGFMKLGANKVTPEVPTVGIADEQ